jgi:RimJ/RimL family protein N-acetyltransferase
MDASYPKRITLKNGAVAVLRPLQPSDEAALCAFFTALPPESTQFLRHDVRDPAVTRRFVRENNPEEVWCILALTEDGQVIGDATLHLHRTGWRRHIGEVRVVVAPALEHQRLATGLIHDLVNQASLRGLRKLEARVLDVQEGAKRAFEKLGFREEARLARHALDLREREHDLVFLTNTVEDLWRKMEDVIHDMELRHWDHGS